MDDFEKARFEVYLSMGLHDVEHFIEIGNIDWAKKTFVQMQFISLDYPDDSFGKSVLAQAEELLTAAEQRCSHEVN